MLRKIILVDYSSRTISVESPSIELDGATDASDNFWDSMDIHPSETNKQIYPMDVFLILYLSADPLFQRKILQKLSKCKLSLPLIISDPSTCQPKIFAFPFQSLSSEWKKAAQNEKAKESIPFDEPMPIISFIRFGDHTSDKFSKSKILNDILGSKHDCFIHRNSPGSTKTRLLFDGTVELSWFLPSKSKENIFSNPITFLNLRGNAAQHLKQLNFLQQVSNKIFLIFWSDKISQNEINSLNELYNRSGSKIVCVFPSFTTEAKNIIRSCPNSKGDTKHAVMLGKVNWSADISNLSRLIDLHSQDPAGQLCSLADHINAANHGLEVDLNELYFKEAELEVDLFTKPLLIDSNEYGSKALRHIKDTYLILQGKPWEEWCKYNTENYRLKHCKNISIEEYRSQLRTLMNECRNAQIDVLSNISNMNFLYEILKICRFSFIKPFYSELFWNKLQLSLDIISAKHLPLLYEEHNIISKLKNTRDYVESISSNPYANLTDAQLKTEFYRSAKNLSKSSLGLEHVIRELSQVFEAYSSASVEQKGILDQKLPIDISKLPIFAANFLLQGYPLEILDGDVSHVPTNWLSNVLEQLRLIVGNKRIYIVSILGVQSSGKSTLLNTMFGLQFAVSAGRCTKGIFMQMIPVNSDVTDFLGYDYLVILDTEGLRAPELDSEISRFHDNELATFAIGLSHLTIINIMGESPTEMENILQITVHAFLRMNLTWIKPRCIFVHQNVTSVDSEEKLAPIRNALISKLNEMTEVAAKHESLSYRFFSELIQFNPDEDVLYFPSLYEGDPPMAPISMSYSRESLKLKSNILRMFINFPNLKIKKLSSLGTNINQLWTAILHENFIFHFKNVQEVNAQRELDYALSEWYYSYTQRVHDWQIDAFASLSNTTEITLTMQQLENTIKSLCEESSSEEQLQINHNFFEANDKVEVFTQWESRTKDFFDESRRILQKETIYKCLTQYELILNQNQLSKKIGEIERSLVVKVKEFLKTVDDLQNPDKSSIIYETFEKLWQQWESSLKIQQTHIEKSNISYDLYDFLNNNSEFVRSHHKFLNRIRNLHNYTHEGKSKFRLYKNHLRFLCDFDPNYIHKSISNAISRRDTQHLDYYERKIFYAIMDYLVRISQACKRCISDLPHGINYNKSYFSMLAKCISSEIHAINEEENYNREVALQFSDIFTKEHIFYQCCRAIPQFTRIQETYIERYSLETQLKTLKEKYFRVFQNSIRESRSEKACSEHLSDIVLDGMKNYLIGYLDRITVEQFVNDNQEALKSKGTIQLAIIKSLVNEREQKFSRYLPYIKKPNRCIQNWFRQQFRNYIKLKTSLDQIKSSLMFQINILLGHYVRSAKSIHGVETWNEWKRSFQSKISNRICDLRYESLTVLDSYDVQNFLQLVSFFQHDIYAQLQKIDWMVWIRVHISVNCDPFIKVMKSKLDCTAVCPFCREPCQLSIGNHKKHYCGSLHRVEAVIGRWEVQSRREVKSRRMYLSECTSSVRDDCSFYHNGRMYSFSEMHLAGPRFSCWSIIADDAYESKFWQWFTVYFEGNLKRHYGYESHPDLKFWKNITKQQVLQDLNQSYQQFN